LILIITRILIMKKTNDIITKSLVLSLFYFIVCSAHAGFFETKPKNQDRDVIACWNAVKNSIPEKYQKMNQYPIRYNATNPKTGLSGVQFDGSMNTNYNTRGCILSESGTVTRVLGLP